MITLIHPPNKAIINTYTDIQNVFINLIKTQGICIALDWLQPLKNETELSFPKPIRFDWIGENEGEYVLEISEKQDFSVSYKVKTHTPFYNITNLKTGQEYYWRVNGGDFHSFKTKDNNYRFIEADGALNVRDLGGINIKQGLLFRGSEINKEYKLTDIGKAVMNDSLKIKTELDLRKETMAMGESSCIGTNVSYIKLPSRPYCEIFEEEHRKGIVDIMDFLADENNYPIYFHCLGGADRTGMISLFLRALLYETDEDILTDYELTSLSSYAYGLSEGVADLGFRSRESYYFQEFLSVFNNYKGTSLSDKTESFLLECNVKSATIEKIRKILMK